MAQYLLPAVVTGLFALLAALVTAYQSDLVFIFRPRKRRIKGTWTGHASEKMLSAPPEELAYDLTFEFRQFGSRVTGRVDCIASNGEHYKAKLKGQMEDDHFVTLVVRSLSPQDFSFGVVVLELDAKGKQLKGYGLGNGLSAHGIAFSEVTLSKEPN